MAYYLISDKNNYGIDHIFFESDDDLTVLPHFPHFGSDATNITNGQKYVINSLGQWAIEGVESEEEPQEELQE